jgi:hypothetical protein
MRRLSFFVVVSISLFVATSAVATPFSATTPVAVSSTGASPLATCTSDGANQQSGEFFPSGEVEPWVASEPGNAQHLVAAWQQDRWSNGGSRGLVSAVSTNGGDTWSTPQTLTFSSFCTGGTVANGGDFDRATDPWVTIAPDGDVFLMSLSIDDPEASADHAMLAMRSTDGGLTWQTPTTLIREDNPNVLNDKNSMTADPNEADGSHVYAVWDRLVFPNERARGRAAANAGAFTGPALFTRTTNGGTTWETPKVIFDQRGKITQTIANQIVVLPDLNNTTHEGQLINGFTGISVKRIGFFRSPFALTVIRSPDQGATWSGPIVIAREFALGTEDPLDGTEVRTSALIPDFAVDQSNGRAYAVWQDARFNGFQADGILMSMSTDGGLTWSSPVEVNKTPTNIPIGNQQAFTPSVHVLPDGTVGVSYYDFRNNGTDTATTQPLETDHFIVHCHAVSAADSDLCADTGGWDEDRITPSSFDMRQAPVARGYFVGDYVGLTNTGATGNMFAAVFGQAFAGDPATVFSSRIGP